MPDVPTSLPSSNPAAVPTDAKTVLDLLLEEQQVTKEQYEEIKVKSATQGQSPTSILESMNIVGDDKIAQAQAKLLGIPYVSLAAMSFSPQALGYLSRAVVDRFALIPFLYDDTTKTLSVAMANPVDLDAIAFIRQKTGLILKTYAASPTEVKNAINQQYRQELVGEVGEAIKETEEYAQKKTVDSTQIAQLITDAPIAKIVSTILEYAVNSRASDVHIEPQGDRVRVRYRIDGILYDKLSLPYNVLESLVSRIKILAELKIDERRMPQDGRFNFKVGQNEVDLRVSTIPTVKGEKIVMRLLRKSGGIPTLPELGLNGTALKSLENAILKPHGIIIVCGPTGSGKTTTLYALLSRLNTTRINIVSLEDPVEYEIPGVNQVQVNPAVGLTFASGLRSFLRQDPNVILVGEIRDKETDDLAIQAALTGHLVFSTLHTSDASGALPRLLDLGAEGFLLASTINAIVGQRIVRRICPHCKEGYIPPQQLALEIKEELGKLYNLKEEMKMYRGKGCSECGGLGYLGRVGIYEVLPITDKISRLILEHSDLEKIIDNALTDKERGVGKYKKSINEEAKELLIRLSGGDARIMLNAIEIMATTYKEKKIAPEIVKEVFQTRSAGIYDKKADEHYNIISAFIKSMRGSDVDAALYYLARMLENGEDPKFIARRMIIFASEDVGMADRGALIQANEAFEAVTKIGMPEAQLTLAHVVIYLSTAKKSRTVPNALGRAKQAVYDFPNEPVPLHLRNAPTKLMKNLGYAKNYEWSDKYVGPKEDLSFLPDKLKNKKFYEH